LKNRSRILSIWF